MWWRTVFVISVLILRNTAETINNGTVQQCCPCPVKSDAQPNLRSSEATGGLDSVPQASTVPQAPRVLPDSRASILDDCPCRPRDADSDGSASILFPKAVRPLGSFVSPSDPKDEMKPLLHPEVDLASSVLETLREATDEEYRDAVERDAARSAAKEMEPVVPDMLLVRDVTPEESRNVVTIIVSPNDLDTSDDTAAEASHVQETRCIHPSLGMARPNIDLRARNPHRGLEEILNLPLPVGLLHRNIDTNFAASDVHESVVKLADSSMNRLLDGLRLKSRPSLLNLPSPGRNGASIINIGKPKSNFRNAYNVDTDEKKNIPRFNLESDDKKGEKEDTFEDDQKLRNIESDCNTAPTQNEAIQMSAEKTAINNELPHKQPFLKNLLNLKDVELLPLNINKKIAKPKLLIPKFRLNSGKDTGSNDKRILKFPSLTELLNTNTKLKENDQPNNKNSDSLDDLILDSNSEKNSKKNMQSSKVIDSDPSPSKVSHIIHVNNNCDEMESNLDTFVENIDNKDLSNTPRKDLNNDSFQPSSITNVDSNIDNEENINNQEVDNGLFIDQSPVEEEGSIVQPDSISKEDPGISSEEASGESINNQTVEKGSIISESSAGTADSERDSFENIDLQNSPSENIINEVVQPNAVAQNNVNLSHERDNEDDMIIEQPSEETNDIARDLHLGNEKLESQDKIIESNSLKASNLKNTQDSIKNDATTISSLNTLESIKQRVVQKLDDLQKSSRKAIDNIKSNVKEISLQNKKNEFNVVHSPVERNENFNDEDAVLPGLLISQEVDNSTAVTETNLTFKDLQNMADSTLMASMIKEQRIPGPQIDKTESSKSDEISDSELDEILSMDGIDKVKSKEKELARADSTEKILDNLSAINCPSDLSRKPTKETERTVISNKGLDSRDMETLASEPTTSSIFFPGTKTLKDHLNDLGSKLRASAIVQPTSLINSDDMNNFRRPSLNIPDISDLDSNIPTLEEVRTQISNILGTLARTPGDDDVSMNFDSENLDTNDIPVLSTGASTSNSISVLPSLKPLEDINLDILQLKPLSILQKGSPLTSKQPGFNINTYRAKLAVPKSLQLKPLNLKSTLGRNGDLLGATLSVGSKPKTNLKSRVQTSSPIGKIAENTMKNLQKTLNSQTSSNIRTTLLKNTNDLLDNGREVLRKSAGSSVDNLIAPSENHLRNVEQVFNIPNLVVVRQNTEKLLKSQQIPTGNDVLERTAHVINSLRSQTDDAMKNIQDSLKSPSILDVGSKIQEHAQILKSSLITAGQQGAGKTTIPLDNVKSQSKSIDQVLKSPSLDDISSTIQEHANNLLQSARITNFGEGVLGDTLQTATPIEDVVNNLKSRTENTVKNIQKTLNTPKLSEITENAQNLLNSPMLTAGRDALGQSLQASLPIDLQSHAENTVKNIQKTLKATLKQNPINNLQYITNPKDVLHMISNTHEDINDKLYALHTDLNDRLTTMHNEIMDPERLRSILAPPSNRRFELFAIPIPTSRMNPTRRKSARLQTKQPLSSSRRMDSNKSRTSIVTKPRSRTSKPSQATNRRVTEKSFRMPAAASSPVLKQVQKPTPIQSLMKPVFPKPLTNNKIKVTFGTTTSRPVKVAAKTPIVPTTVRPKIASNNRFKPKGLTRQPTPWSSWNDSARNAPSSKSKPFDQARAPSVVVPSKTVAPVSPKLRKPGNIALKTERPSLLSTHRNAKPLLAKPILKHEVPSARGGSVDRNVNTLERPKSPLLTKLSETLKARQGKNNLKSPKELEMSPSASDNFERAVALEQPMKEKVTYQCKMTCVKV